MNDRFPISELIASVSKTYRAIDIRCAAIREGEVWTNYIMAVRLTYETPETANERLRKLETQHGPVNTERFRIIFKTRPYDEWSDFCKAISRGSVGVGGFQIGLNQGITFENESVQLLYDSQYFRAFDGRRWPVAELRLRPHQSLRLNERPWSRDLAMLGYTDPYDAVNSLCELNVGLGASEFCLALPIFAALDDARVISADRKLELLVRRHNKLSNLHAFAFFREGNFRVGPPSKHRITIPIAKESEECPIITEVAASAELPDVNYDEYVDVKLIYPEIGEVDHLARGLRFLLPPAERNFLFEALKRFCPENQLEQLFSNPDAMRIKPSDLSRAFEFYVAWILGLFGFPAVVLGRYEHIKAGDTKVQLESVDILAADPKGKTLYLVACTIGVPKEEDFSHLLNAREILRNEVFSQTAVAVESIIFTGARGFGPYKEIHDSVIPVLDMDGIQALLALLKVGREADFLNFLGEPRLYPLRNLTSSA